MRDENLKRMVDGALREQVAVLFGPRGSEIISLVRTAKRLPSYQVAELANAALDDPDFYAASWRVTAEARADADVFRRSRVSALGKAICGEVSRSTTVRAANDATLGAALAVLLADHLDDGTLAVLWRPWRTAVRP